MRSDSREFDKNNFFDEDPATLEHRRLVRLMLDDCLEKKRLKRELAEELDDEYDSDFDFK